MTKQQKWLTQSILLFIGFVLMPSPVRWILVAALGLELFSKYQDFKWGNRW